jgi:hypothetical protein
MQADMRPTIDLARRMQQEIAASLPSKETVAQFQASLPSPDVLAGLQSTHGEAQRQFHDAILTTLPDTQRMLDHVRHARAEPPFGTAVRCDRSSRSRTRRLCQAGRSIMAPLGRATDRRSAARGTPCRPTLAKLLRCLSGLIPEREYLSNTSSLLASGCPAFKGPFGDRFASKTPWRRVEPRLSVCCPER